MSSSYKIRIIEKELYRPGIGFIPRNQEDIDRKHGDGIRQIEEFDFFDSLLSYGKR